jgi:hypothetical protein
MSKWADSAVIPMPSNTELQGLSHRPC